MSHKHDSLYLMTNLCRETLVTKGRPPAGDETQHFRVYIENQSKDRAKCVMKGLLKPGYVLALY